MSTSEEMKMRDAIIIGAGVTGIYLLHLLKDLGLDTRAAKQILDDTAYALSKTPQD